MKLHLIDWVLIAAYFVLSLAIGLYYSRRAGKSVSEYFVSGRALPWWLAGTSMAAAAFSVDTPLAISNLVYTRGIGGNWILWTGVLGGMLTVFFFSRLWRRVEVVTDQELAELRYGGKPAAFLRGFRALYLGIIINCIMMGWVINAGISILSVSLDLNRWWAMVICLALAALYVTLGGLQGAVVTSFFQYLVAMGGSLMLALFALNAVGGIDGLKARMLSSYGAERAAQIFRFAPTFHSGVKAGLGIPLSLFFVYIGVQWWASWYVGAEPGGGGYIAQRMLASKDEKNSFRATLWFNIANYALGPWLWILVGLASLVLLPGMQKPQDGYVKMMTKLLPSGCLGLMIAGLAATLMSTISTHLNWGSSYIINDFYRRFLKKDASEKHYVNVSRLVTLLMMIAGGMVGYMMQSIRSGWELLLTIGAGTGLVYILRWYWWRINAWSEISAMSAALVVSVWLRYSEFAKTYYPNSPSYVVEILFTVAVTTVVWVAATFVTKPETDEVLAGFVKRARPAGWGWKKIRDQVGDLPKSPDRILGNFITWILGTCLVYFLLFGIGKLILKEFAAGAFLIALAITTAIGIYFAVSAVAKGAESS